MIRSLWRAASTSSSSSSIRFLSSTTASCSSSSSSSSSNPAPQQTTAATVVDDEALRQKVVSSIHRSLASEPRQPLFAVVYVANRQFKVTSGDVVALRGDQPLKIGQEIVLNKILLVGGRDWTLAGRPLLPTRAARVKATVVEQTATAPTILYNDITSSPDIGWKSEPCTLLRITAIEVDGEHAMGEPRI